jgi:hypothetical protein
MFSDLNHLLVADLFRSEYKDKFGFTQDEVLDVLTSIGRADKIDEVKEWYNGYEIEGVTLYNPWSFINYLKNNLIAKAYWVNTGSVDIYKKILSNVQVDALEDLVLLSKDEPIYQKITENLVIHQLNSLDISFWTMMLYGGYLNIEECDFTSGGHYLCKLRAPNKEIRSVFDIMISDWFIHHQPSNSAHQKFVNCFISRDSGEIFYIKNIIENYLNSSTSAFDFSMNSKEKIFHIFMLGILYSLHDYYKISSNEEAGFGRFDVMLCSRKDCHRSYILEFKVAKDNDDIEELGFKALEQIKTKKYISILQHRENKKDVTIISLVFKGKEVFMKSEIV